jgi:anaerobic dimethyl sulfoxide reductase subunit B (iron-sulfur subunit)
MERVAFFFDSSACSGCKTCQMACKEKNDLATGQVWRRVYEINAGGWTREGGTWLQDIMAYNLSMSCNHCADPICVKNCPTRAMFQRDDGIVLINQDDCIGCKYCAWACPYGAPQYNPKTGKMGKCDLCVDYLDAGKRPSCVDACPMRALDIGDYADLVHKYGESENIYPLPDEQITGPSMIVRAHCKAIGADAEVANVEEVRFDQA